MSLRARLTAAGAGAVFVALAVASLVIYFDVRSNLREQVDASLIQSAQGVAAKWNAETAQLTQAEPAAGAAADKLAHVREPLSGVDGSGSYQVIPSVSAATTGRQPLSGPRTPAAHAHRGGGADGLARLTSSDARVARGVVPPYFQVVRYRGVAMELYTMALGSSRAGLVRAAEPLGASETTLARVRWLLVGLTLAGALVAGLFGRLAANAVLRPVRALAGAVRDVSATRDLKRRIPVSGRDELASLAADFNAMLAALDDSQQAQQQLIADASHELRTPLTAHRANIELLARPDLPVEQRQRVLAAAVRSIGELSVLVGDLIAAAREGRSVDARESLELDRLVASAVERAQHRAPALRFETRLERHRVVGARSRLERALDSVLDNAIKWSTPGDSVEIGLRGGDVTVRDHGPGIDAADLANVFDRFYRAAAARALPGSGLGLAIVKQTVEAHGGRVAAANAEGGGALITLRFGPTGL